MRAKSVWAVIAGVLVVVVLTTIVDAVLHVTRVFPPIDQPINDRLALLALSYRVVLGVAGAWITARLAPEKPLQHAMVLGGVGTLIGLVGVVATWNLGLGPHWYPIAVAAAAIPQSWIGGTIAVRAAATGGSPRGRSR